MIDPVELFVSRYSDDDSDDPVASFVRKYSQEQPRPRQRKDLSGREGRSVFRSLARKFGDQETRERLTEEESRESGIRTLPTVRVEAEAPPLARTRQFGKQALRGMGEATLSTAAGAANLVGADRVNEAINRQRDEMREAYGEPLGGAGMAGLLTGSLAENMAMYALAPSALAGLLRGGAGVAKAAGADRAVRPLLKGSRAIRDLSAASAGAKGENWAKRVGAGVAIQAPLDIAVSQDEQGNTASFLGEVLDSDRMRRAAKNPLAAAATELVAGNLIPGAAFEGARSGLRAAKKSEFGQAVKEMKDDGVFQLGGLTTKDVGEEPKRFPDNLYSRVERNISSAPAEKMQGRQWLAHLKKGAAQGELEWTGLKSMLEREPDRVFTRGEVKNHFDQNRVELEVTELTGKKQHEDLSLARYGDGDQWVVVQRGQAVTAPASRESAEASMKGLIADETKFSQYTEPGGEGYKEVLVRLKQPDVANIERRLADVNERIRRMYEEGVPAGMSDEQAKAYYRGAGAEKQALEAELHAAQGRSFKSGHWDQPDVLVSLRQKDRVTPDGKKVRYVEEIQSDWHQQGRQSGYQDPEARRQYDAIWGRMEDILGEEVERVQQTGVSVDKYGQVKLGPDENGEFEYPPGQVPHQYREMVARGLRTERPDYQELMKEQEPFVRGATASTPNAPFKKTEDWTALAWKKVIDDAVADGVDHIAWTPGKVQAERYDLSKQVSEIRYSHDPDGTYRLDVTDINGEAVDGIPSRIPEAELEKYVGKELAEKMAAGGGSDLEHGISWDGKPVTSSWRTLSGIDLQVGGEGMKKFYDEVLPNSLKKYAKSLGVVIEPTTVNVGAPRRLKNSIGVWGEKTRDGRLIHKVFDGGRDGTLLGSFNTLEEAQAFRLKAIGTEIDPSWDRPGVPTAPFREALERTGGQQPLWSAAAAGGALTGDDEDSQLRNAILFGAGAMAMMGRTKASAVVRGVPAALQDGALDATVAKITQYLAHNQGFSLAPHTGELLGKQTPGFALGVGRDMGVKLEADELTPDALREFVRRNRKLFASNPNLLLGGWRNPETGKFDLEPAELVMDRRLAAREGMRRGEQAIHDFTNDRDISVKPVTFDRYSATPGRTRMLARYAGSGPNAGEEKLRPNRPKVVHVYDHGAEPETQFRDYKVYHIDAPEGQIYDASVDPDGIVKRSLARKPGDADAWEKAIEKAGYDGYYVSSVESRKHIKKLFGDWDVREDSPGLVDAPPPPPDAMEYMPLRVKKPVPAGTQNVEEVAAILAKGRKAVGGEITEQVREAVRRGLPEVRDALEKSGGEAWYRAELAAMDRALQEMVPELADPTEMRLFRFLLAVTSPQQKPHENLVTALGLYNKYLQGGQQLSALSPYRNAAKRIVDQSLSFIGLRDQKEAALRKLEAYLGPDRALWQEKLDDLYLTRIDEPYKPRGSKEGIVEDKPLAADMFGPKVGRFYANLNGYGKDVTVDLWAGRTLRSWLGITPQAGKEAVSDIEGAVMRKALVELAEQMSIEQKRFIDPMDIQAALWYYEKRRYAQLGARPSGEESYRHAAERLAAARGAGTPGADAPGRGAADGAAADRGRAQGQGKAGDPNRRLGRGDAAGRDRNAPDAAQARRKRRGAADPRALGEVAVAGGGAIAGSLVDDESPGRGALVGAVIGYGGGRVSHALVKTIHHDIGKLSVPVASMPAHARAASLIDFDGSQTRGWAKELRGSLRDRISRIADMMDASRPIERIGSMVEGKLRPTENPKYLLSRVRAADETIRTAINEGVVDFDTREVVAPSYRAIFEPLGHNDHDIRAGLRYAVSKRKLDRGLAFVGGDQQQLDDAAIVVRDLGSRPEIVDFEQRLSAYTEALGDYAVKSGLWTPELWAKIRQSDALYLPFRRILDSFHANNGKGGIGGRLANVTPGVKKATGSRRSIENPAVALAEYTESIIRRADQYRIGHTLFDAVDALGAEGEAILTRIPANEMGRKAPEIERARKALEAAGIDPAIAEELAGLHVPDVSHHNPVIWRNGPNGKEYAVVQNRSLWEALGTLRPESREGIRAVLDLTIRPLKRVFTAATTGLNPRFAFGTNPTRDVVQAWQQSTSGVRVTELAKAWYQAIAASNALSPLAGAALGAGVGELTADNPLAGAMIGAGGGSAVARIGGQKMIPKGVRGTVGQASRAGLGHTALTAQAVDVGAAARRFAPTTRWHRFRATLEQITGAPVRFVEGVAETSDRAPRVAEYLAAARSKQHMVDRGLWTPADLRLYAATKARNATIDFSRKASSPVLRFAGDYIPFFNVAIQAPVRYTTAWKESPKRMAAASAGIALASVAAWALKERDEDSSVQVNDRPATERAAFLLFPLGDGNVVRLPMGQENGLIAAAVTAGLDKLTHDDPHAGKLMREAIVRALPPGFGGTVVPIPLVQQLQEVQRNRTDYGGRPVEPKRMEGALPAERRLDTTAPTFDAAAALARKIPGLEDTSPLQAEHVIRGVTSGFTPAITKLTDPLAEMAGFAPAKSRIPLGPGREPLNPTSAFLARTPPTTTESEQDYYNLRTTFLQVQEKRRSLESALKSAQGDPATMQAVVGEAQKFQGAYQGFLSDDAQALFKGADDRLKKLREDERRVLEAYRRGVFDGDQAREIADRIRHERQELYRMVLPILQRLGVPGAMAPKY